MEKKRLMIVLTIGLFLIFVPFMANAEQMKTRAPVGLMILDLIIVRPVSAAVATASTVFCAAISPGTYLTGVGEPSARILVEAPWRFTAARPLGDFSGATVDGKPLTNIGP